MQPGCNTKEITLPRTILKKMKKSIFFLFAIAATFTATAQELTYDSYMQRVLENNTAIVAEAMNIDIAQAALKNSKVYNDPTLSVQYANNEDWNTDLGQSIAANLSRTFTLGVRRAGIRLADKELQATTAVFNDYMRNFHADATLAYLRHIRAKELQKIAANRESYMQQLAQSDSLRYTRGEIAKTVWIESRLAAGLTRNGRLQADAELRNSSIELGYYMGTLDGSEEIVAEGTLESATAPLESPDRYIKQALANRADLLVAVSRVDVANAEKRLNSARRRIELELSIGAEYNKADPSFTKLMVGVAIPLRFSNLNSGARAMDRAKVQQAEGELADTRMLVQSEVMQAYNNCRIAGKQKETFTQGMMQETAELLQSKRKAYQMGEISFVDFIETERSDNMMQEEYINSLYNSAASYVELQRCIGITAESTR